MAAFLARRPLLISATMLSVAGAAYYSTTNPQLLDSPANRPRTKTLAFPATMLVSRLLTVTSSEQVNHDTKRITFALPGGMDETSGVGPGGKFCRILQLDKS